MATKLIEEVKNNVKEYSTNKDVSDFLYLIADNTLNEKNDKDVKNELIRGLFREGFEIHDPTKTKKIGSKVIQQVLWRVMSKVQFLKSDIHGTGKSENAERLVTEGVMTVAKRGGLAQLFGGKCGVFMNAFMYGDGYVMLGKGENEENPVSFRVLRNEDVYADTFSYGVRGVKPARKMCVIYQFGKDEAYEIFPELEENGVWGRIPGTYEGDERDDDRENKDILEIGWGWDLDKGKYVIFAGTQGYQIDMFEGEEYPFIKNKKKFIPVFQFMCQPSEEGFRNYGIGEMVYDLAVITAKLMNMEVGHLEENVYPLTLINAPQTKVDELVQKMATANESRAAGGKPFVAMEFGAGGGSPQAQSLLTQNLFNEWNVVWDRLYKEFSRLGFNLDDIERGSGITRGQVIAEEQAGNAFIQQMQEYNSWETEELIECVMDSITEFVSNGNKTPLNLMTTMMMEDGTALRLDTEITMGMLSKELKDGNWFVNTDKRTGAIPSDLTKMLQEEKLLSMEQPGTPAFEELKRRISMRMGVGGNKPMPMASEPPAPGGPGGGAPPAGAPGEMPVATPGQNQRVLPEPTGNVLQPV